MYYFLSGMIAGYIIRIGHEKLQRIEEEKQYNKFFNELEENLVFKEEEEEEKYDERY